MDKETKIKIKEYKRLVKISQKRVLTTEEFETYLNLADDMDVKESLFKLPMNNWTKA